MEHAASRYAIHGKVSRRPSLGSRAQRSRFPTAKKVQKRVNTCKSSDVEALHNNPHSLDSRRAALAALLGGAFIGALPAEASESPSVLEWRGLRGFVVDEEQRAKLEAEARTNSEGLLCATPFSVDIVGITELLALIGAVVGGYSARQRKVEVERLNEQLRKINVQLRQQARSNAVYATGLNCAPSPPPPAAPETPLPPPPTAAATKSGEPLTVLPETRPSSAGNGGAQGRVERAEGAAAHTLSSMDDALMTAEQLECRDTLREGKKLLKVSGSAAMVRFEKGLVLAKALRDKISERRALRGLAAASRMQGKIRNAISFLEKVLAVSVEMQEFTGDSDAYGTIADLYTELGEFEKAAVFYDKYISRMMEDGTVV